MTYFCKSCQKGENCILSYVVMPTWANVLDFMYCLLHNFKLSQLSEFSADLIKIFYIGIVHQTE